MGSLTASSVGEFKNGAAIPLFRARQEQRHFCSIDLVGYTANSCRLEQLFTEDAGKAGSELERCRHKSQ
jgi:hypothetical protein